MKRSSRAGRFKKKLVSEELLAGELPLIQAKMAPLQELHSQKILSDAELCGLFIVNVLKLRFPRTWSGSRRPPLPIKHHMPFKLEEGLTLGEVFSGYALKSTPEAVNRALLSWSNGSYPLELMFRIPSPEEVLGQQKRGRRCVTVLPSARYVLGERDHLSFTMHDLIHADHFYFHNECYLGQLGFYGLLDTCLHRGDFNELLKVPKFKEELEYLISDMNAYAIHLLKCLKSAMVHYGSPEVFADWVKDFSVREQLLELNSPTYSPEASDHIILKWLDGFRKAGSAPN